MDIDQIYYDGARKELIARIGYRDGALLAYIATAGGYISFSAEQFLGPVVDDLIIAFAAALGLPLLSIIFTMVILQHHSLIGQIQAYIIAELFKDAGVKGYDEYIVPTGSEKKSMDLRSWSQAIVLTFPTTATLIFALRLLGSEVPANAAYDRLDAGIVALTLIFIELLAAVFIVSKHIEAHIERRRLNAVSSEKIAEKFPKK